MDDETVETLRLLAARPAATADAIAHQVGLSLDEVRQALALLEEEGYVAHTAAGVPHGEPRYVLTAAGYGALGTYPECGEGEGTLPTWSRVDTWP